MDRSSLRSFTSLFCGDPNQTRFSATQYNDALNIANVRFAILSKSVFTEFPITSVDGTATYDLPTDFYRAKRMTFKGLELDPKTRADLLSHGDDFSDDEGTPLFYIVDPDQSRKTIRLVPIPQSGDAGNNMVLEYYQIPPDMTSDSAVPLNDTDLLVQYHIAIAQYAAYLLLGYDTQTVELQAKRADFLHEFENSVTDAIDNFGTTANAPLRMKGGRRWRF